jgi:MFS family permease
MRAAILGGFTFRLGIGALPFLLPLLLQVGFGLTPFHSGLITFGSAVGALFMKTLAARMLNTFGFRNVMVVDAVVSAGFLAVCSLFTPETPLSLILVLLIVGGFFRSLQFTAINTIGYAEVDMARMSRATTLVSVTQQLAISAGVAVGAFSVELTLLMRKGDTLTSSDFAPAFIVVALISASSAIIFARMPSDAGHQVGGGRAKEIASRKEVDKAAQKAAIEETDDNRDQRLG